MVNFCSFIFNWDKQKRFLLGKSNYLTVLKFYHYTLELLIMFLLAEQARCNVG